MKKIIAFSLLAFIILVALIGCTCNSESYRQNSSDTTENSETTDIIFRLDEAPEDVLSKVHYTRLDCEEKWHVPIYAFTNRYGNVEYRIWAELLKGHEDWDEKCGFVKITMNIDDVPYGMPPTFTSDYSNGFVHDSEQYYLEVDSSVNQYSNYCPSVGYVKTSRSSGYYYPLEDERTIALGALKVLVENSVTKNGEIYVEVHYVFTNGYKILLAKYLDGVLLENELPDYDVDNIVVVDPSTGIETRRPTATPAYTPKPTATPVITEQPAETPSTTPSPSDEPTPTIEPINAPTETPTETPTQSPNAPTDAPITTFEPTEEPTLDPPEQETPSPETPEPTTPVPGLDDN